jgi:SNF family Na+-dependent transporter
VATWTVFLSLIVYSCIPDPYFVMLATEGIPVLKLELEIGQRLRKGVIGVWNCHLTSGLLTSTVLSCPSAKVSLVCGTVILPRDY